MAALLQIIEGLLLLIKLNTKLDNKEKNSSPFQLR